MLLDFPLQTLFPRVDPDFLNFSPLRFIDVLAVLYRPLNVNLKLLDTFVPPTTTVRSVAEMKSNLWNELVSCKSWRSVPHLATL